MAEADAGAAPPAEAVEAEAAAPGSRTNKGGWIEHEAAAIEVDEAIGEGDETGESSYATSLASSVVDYPYEHGRRYHAFRAGRYSRPNDEQEMNRLLLLHEIMTRLIGGLYMAPVDKAKTKRILDIGTGTGIWPIEIAEEFPEATIIGNDLSANQIPLAPPNVKFEVDDVEDPWVHTAPFDWIFSRYMAASIHDWPKLVGNVFANLRPGGHAEFQDFNLLYYSPDGTLTPSHSLLQWISTLCTAAASLGREPNPGSKLPQWLADAGFTHIEHRTFRVPIGPWPRDAKLKEVGAWNLEQVLNGLEGLSMRLYCGVLGWGEEEVRELLGGVRRELLGGRVHACFDFHVVYGQKPE